MELVRQVFNGAVGEVAHGDIINHHHTHGRLLTKAERVDLNKDVRRLETEFGEPAWQTWKFLHRTIGVENIEGMCLGHRDQAEAILKLLLERATYHRASQVRPQVVTRHSDQEVALARRNQELEGRIVHQQQAYSALEQRFVRSNSLVVESNKVAKKLRTMRVIAAICVAMAVGVGWYSMSVGAELNQARAQSMKCNFEGDSFEVGAILDQRNGPDLKCSIAGPGQIAQWWPVKASSAKKPIGQRRPVRPEQPAAAAGAVAPIGLQN